jgi:hypothetical protein
MGLKRFLSNQKFQRMKKEKKPIRSTRPFQDKQEEFEHLEHANWLENAEILLYTAYWKFSGLRELLVNFKPRFPFQQ